MKQFLVVLFLAAAALAFYAFTRAPKQPDAPKPGSGAALSAPTTQRPTVTPNPQDPKLPRAGAVTLSPELQAKKAAADAFDWSSSVDPEMVVPIDEAWGFDLSKVDFQADVLCVVGGVPITQEDLRRWCVLTIASPAVDARLFACVARDIAAQTGQPYGMSDQLFDQYLEQWCATRSLTREQGEQQLARLSKLPVALTLSMRRDILETILAYFPPVETATDLPGAVRDALPGPDSLVNTMQILSLLNEARSDLSTPDNMAKFVTSLEVLPAMWMQVGREERFRRSWTSLDMELPAGMVAAITTGPLPEVDVVPPWLLPGTKHYVEYGPIWDSFGPLLGRTALEDNLRAVIWTKVLRQELAKMGTLPTPERAWQNYALDYLKGANAMLGIDMVAVMIQGYPTTAHWRSAEAIRTGFFDAQPPGWDSESVLRPFFEKNRFFIQGWVPDLQIALFPPVDPTQVLPGEELVPDYERAKAEALAFRERALAGDFDTLLFEHNQELRRGYEQALGKEAATDFDKSFENGRLSRSLNAVNELLKESRFQQQIDGVSVLRNAVARLERNQLSPPWLTGIGYVIVRVSGARLVALEDEFEDQVERTRYEFRDAQFQLWTTRTLRAKDFELAK